MQLWHWAQGISGKSHILHLRLRHSFLAIQHTPSPVVSESHLASVPAFLPLIGLTNSSNTLLCATLQTPGELQSCIIGATGHSQGIISAVAIAASATLLTTPAMPWNGSFIPASDINRHFPSIVNNALKGGKGTPGPVLSMTSLSQGRWGHWRVHLVSPHKSWERSCLTRGGRSLDVQYAGRLWPISCSSTSCPCHLGSYCWWYWRPFHPWNWHWHQQEELDCHLEWHLHHHLAYSWKCCPHHCPKESPWTRKRRICSMASCWTSTNIDTQFQDRPFLMFPSKTIRTDSIRAGVMVSLPLHASTSYS